MEYLSTTSGNCSVRNILPRVTPRPSKANTPINRLAVSLVREALSTSSLTRQELSARSGVPEGTIAGLLAGTKPIYVDQLVALGAALGADWEDWLGVLEGRFRADFSWPDVQLDLRAVADKSPLEEAGEDLP